LPVDVLKIDRSFVRDLTTNRNHRVIVQATIDLANSLGLKTVAEGVEAQEQAAMLAEMGCSSIQGYWIRRPAGAAETAQWLATVEPARSASADPARRSGPRGDPGAEHVTVRSRQQRRDN
jgi:EAL domain-containing protein (putative c-di-GMP-specific phosphodiesterase class I)